MSTICEIMLAAGLTFSNACAPDPQVNIDLPIENTSLWEVPVEEATPPPPPEPKVIVKEIIREVEKEAPPPAPVFPPIIHTVVKEVVREIPAFPAELPPPMQIPEEPPLPIAEEPKIDPVRQWLEAGGSGNRYVAYQQHSFGIYAAPTAKIEAQPVAYQDVTQENAAHLGDLSVPNLEIPETAKKTVKLSQESYETEFIESSLPVDNTRLHAQDRYVKAILETPVNTQIDSDHEGELIIQTAESVYGYHGRAELIPKGSRFICEFDGPEEVDSTRIAITCNRLLLAGSRVELAGLEAPVSDSEGKTGINGEVDNKFYDRYGTSLALAGISSAVRLSSAFVDNDGDDQQSPLGQTIDAGSQELSQKFGEITAAILENNVNLKPVLLIPKGIIVHVRVKLDLLIQKIKETLS